MPVARSDPDKLVRTTPGHYQTADERFSVESEASGAWYVVDAGLADELGLPRVIGPYPTLAAAKAAIRFARTAKPTGAVRRPKARSAPTRAPKPAPVPRKETWLDRLSAADRREAERVKRLLAGAGIPDPDGVARSEIEGTSPALARALLVARLWERVITPDEGKKRDLGPEAGKKPDLGPEAGTLSAEERSVAETVAAVFDLLARGSERAIVAGSDGWQLAEAGGKRRTLELVPEDLFRYRPEGARDA
jgi:hypothetical protein